MVVVVTVVDEVVVVEGWVVVPRRDHLRLLHHVGLKLEGTVCVRSWCVCAV